MLFFSVVLLCVFSPGEAGRQTPSQRGRPSHPPLTAAVYPSSFPSFCSLKEVWAISSALWATSSGLGVACQVLQGGLPGKPAGTSSSERPAWVYPRACGVCGSNPERVTGWTGVSPYTTALARICCCNRLYSSSGKPEAGRCFIRTRRRGPGPLGLDAPGEQRLPGRAGGG